MIKHLHTPHDTRLADATSEQRAKWRDISGSHLSMAGELRCERAATPPLFHELDSALAQAERAMEQVARVYNAMADAHRHTHPSSWVTAQANPDWNFDGEDRCRGECVERNAHLLDSGFAVLVDVTL